MKLLFALSMSTGAALAQTPVGFDQARFWPAAGVDVGPIAVADIDGDQHTDVVIGVGSISGVGGTLQLFRGDGAGEFQPGAVLDALGADPRTLRLRDFDGDARIDVAHIAADTRLLVVRRGVGMGGFGPAISFAAGDEPQMVEVADLDGNGLQDLVVVDWQSDRVGVWLASAPGQFSGPTWWSVGDQPLWVAVADLDGDLVPDLVSTNSGDRTLSMLRGLGAGQFASAQTTQLAPRPGTVVLADLDRDGRVDAVTANGDRTTAVLMGDGAGGFSTPTYFEVGARVFHFEVADVNGDANLDQVVAALDGGAIAVLVGRGDGSFEAPTHFTHSANNPLELRVADFDGDGAVDLVATNGLTGFSVLRSLNAVRVAGYCPSGRFTALPGCAPVMSVSGAPSVSAVDGFRLSVNQLPSSTSGLVFYGVSGRKMTPWSSATASESWLCVRSPTQRTAIGTTSTSSNICDRRFVLDFNRYRTLHPDALGQPFQVGQLVQAQAWLRDTLAGGTVMSAAVEFTLGL